MTLKNYRVPLLCYFKLWASFRSHLRIQTRFTVQKLWIRVKINNFFVPCDLEIWRIILKNDMAPLLCHIKLCASFHCPMWIQLELRSGNTKLDFDLSDLDLWPLTLTFCMTSLLSLKITPENFIMLRWWEHSEKGVTDRQTDRETRRTDRWTEGQPEPLIQLLGCS